MKEGHKYLIDEILFCEKHLKIEQRKKEKLMDINIHQFGKHSF